ncbi:hypothetical protein BN7_6059 [Wickerhamomyces ciferrii]|uniref:Uncharacterized protein n=1 Tax=Wickerhamomyces ciferrii (strain ATCC 14091 / BCRC 22168 / CBS 111 / JCM 3599 / NBRC 0793 / NRRL Y-1031 F-60-10) TaxID=1206466 RepID=K0KTH1_WICCF|nr:uncharacterized protein BN7_6059 [Wickerhamomyces ciferrii]CCH46466.1 hypothetical protein BN7_6059 [Wickerhamomyces ciferrii]
MVGEDKYCGYRSLLYVSQFLVQTGDLERFVTKVLPNLLTRLGINKDDPRRVKVLTLFNQVLVDFQLAKLDISGDDITGALAKTSRNLIRSSLALFGALTTITSIKNLVINLIKNKKLDSSISLKIFQNLGLVSVSLGNLLSSVPSIHLLLNKIIKLDPKTSKKITTFLTALISFSIYPKNYSRDLLSIYVLVYGLESLQNLEFQKGYISTLKEKYPLIDKLTQTWILIPFLLGELYHTYIIHPEHSPSLVKKIFDSQLSDLYDSKPSWYNGKQWPFTTEINQLVRKATVLKDRKLSSTIIQTDVTRITSIQSPLHSNKILSLTNPITPNFIDILQRFIPLKFTKLVLYLIPIYIIKDIITRKLTLETLKTNWKQYLINLLKSISKLSIFTILTTITSHYLTTQNINSRTPIKNFRIIGFIAGLWSILYHKTVNKSIVTYVLRITLLSLWRRKLQKNHKKLENLNLDVLFNSIGWTILVGLYDDGLKEFISPKRFSILSEWISTGGEI